MIQMRVRDDNMAYKLTEPQGSEDSLKVIGIIRTGINHGNIARPHKVRICPFVRHWRRIGGHNAPQSRLQFLGSTDDRAEGVGRVHWVFLMVGGAARV